MKVITVVTRSFLSRVRAHLTEFLHLGTVEIEARTSAALEACEVATGPKTNAGRRPEIRKQSLRWREDQKLNDVVDF